MKGNKKYETLLFFGLGGGGRPVRVGAQKALQKTLSAAPTTPRAPLLWWRPEIDTLSDNLISAVLGETKE